MQEKLKSIDGVLTDLAQRDDNLYRAILEAEPIPRSIRKAGIGGVNRYSELEGFENSDMVIGTAKKLDNIMKKIYVHQNHTIRLLTLPRTKNKCWPACLPYSRFPITILPELHPAGAGTSIPFIK